MSPEDAEAALAKIKPGKTYPRFVLIKERGEPEVKFNMQSYFVGMYCAIYVGGQLACQRGDHNNKGFITKLKKDIAAALKRGAEVDIELISDVKVSP